MCVCFFWFPLFDVSLSASVCVSVCVVLYMPLIKNEHFDPTFDPRENALHGGYCSTFNFRYKPEQVKQLSDLTGKQKAHTSNKIELVNV